LFKIKSPASILMRGLSVMTLFLNPIVFISGLLIGSFLNCVIYRMELSHKGKKASALKGRSFCPMCGHVLTWFDLIPLISFFILKRKCRYCEKKISWQYPLVEISTGLMFVLILNFLKLQITDYELLITFLYLSLISCFLIIIFVYDLKHFIIPDRFLFPSIILVFIYLIITNYELLITNYLFSALGACLFFLIIFLISKGKWLGFGDVKLAFFMGLFLGFPSILAGLFFSFLIGAIIGIILIAFKKKGLKSEIPFGPFLILGTYIAFFWGREIIKWYLNLFNP